MGSWIEIFAGPIGEKLEWANRPFTALISAEMYVFLLSAETPESKKQHRFWVPWQIHIHLYRTKFQHSSKDPGFRF